MAIVTYIVAIFLQWLVKYLYRLNNYSNFKSYPILPILGNTHQLGKKNGKHLLKKLMVIDFIRFRFFF